MPCRESLCHPLYKINLDISLQNTHALLLSLYIRLPIFHLLRFSFSPSSLFFTHYSFNSSSLCVFPISPIIFFSLFHLFSTPSLSSHAYPTSSPAAGELKTARRRGLSQMVNIVACRCLSCSHCPPTPALSSSLPAPAPSRPPGHMSSHRLLSIRPNFSVGFP